jgi:hypothetical protein
MTTVVKLHATESSLAENWTTYKASLTAHFREHGAEEWQISIFLSVAEAAFYTGADATAALIRKGVDVSPEIDARIVAALASLGMSGIGH